MFKLVLASAITGSMSAFALARQIPGADRARFQRDTVRWARVSLRASGITVTGYGMDRINPEGTYVFMANHQSHVDIPTLFVALPIVPGFLAKAELRRVPIFGHAMEVGGHVFVDRDRHQDARGAIAAAAREVNGGKSILIFPEGTRSRRRELLPFKKGGFHLARQAGVPLVPIGIRGTGALLPKHSRDLRSGNCEVHVGEPLTPEQIETLPFAELIVLVRERIAELSELPMAADRSGAE